LEELITREKELNTLIKQREKELKELERRKEEIGKKLQTLKREDELGKYEKELRLTRDKLEQVRIKKGALHERYELLTQNLEELKKEITTLKKEKKSVEEKVKTEREELTKKEKELKKVEKDDQKLVQKIQSLVEKKKELEDGLRELGVVKAKLELEIQELEKKINQYEVEKARVETKLGDLKESFNAYEGVEILEASMRELEEELSKTNEELEGFDSVNLRAIENYERVKEEFAELQEKLETLKKERQEIFNFMEKVERRKREVFMEAFNVVKENFERIYAELAEGQGTLILDNPRDISASGLLISANPGGKKLVSIDAMSGGEKVLTTSAFLLALQQYKPAHFYIIDELDAALDPSNSLRLAEMISKSPAQFILITHNPQVMRKADTILGLSMSRGVSRVVGVKLDEIPKYVDE